MRAEADPRWTYDTQHLSRDGATILFFSTRNSVQYTTASFHKAEFFLFFFFFELGTTGSTEGSSETRIVGNEYTGHR
jgi:hypothetical protein